MKQNFRLTHAVLASTLFLPGILWADTTINAPVVNVAPVDTTTGNITITSTGKITNNTTDAILVDATANVTINFSPAAFNAIETAGAGGNAINITLGPSVINIGANRTIDAVLDGILINSSPVTVTNAGTITATKSAIEVGGNGASALVSNSQGATIQSNAGASQSTILVNATNFGLLNSGTITSGTAKSTIELNLTNVAIVNNATGIISQTANQDVISIQNSTVSISNAGQIAGTNNAIAIGGAGQNVTITNLTGGTIRGGNNLGSAAIFDQGVSGLAIDNTGTIKSVGQGNAIILTKDFSSVMNNVGGLIDGGALGTGLQINAPVAGLIINSGTIQSAAPAPSAALDIVQPFTGTITNNSTGIIQTNAGAGVGGVATILSASFGTFNNAGTIQAPNTGNNAIIFAAPAASTGTFNNSGTTSANDTPAMLLLGDLTAINNTGTIKSGAGVASAVIFAGASPITITNGITNSGNITNTLGAGFAAIDLQTFGGNINVPLIQNGGTITGNVLLASAGGNVLTMTGGTINGDVSAGLANVNTLTLTGGTITGTTTLGNSGDTVNLGGASLQALNGGAGADTFNLTGGSFTALDGNGGADILNVNNSFTANGTIANIPTINVNNTGTSFVMNNNITGLTTLNINAGTSATANQNPVLNLGAANINTQIVGGSKGQLYVSANRTLTTTGTVTNDGNVSIGPGGVLNAGNFTQNATGAYLVDIQQPTFGTINVTTNANLAANSTINANLIPGQFIPVGQTYDIMTVQAGGVLVDNSTLVQPISAVLSFTKSGPGGVGCGLNTCVRLTTQRLTYTQVALSDEAQRVAATLDPLVPGVGGFVNSDLLAVFTQLDLLPTVQDITTALETLAPAFNFGLVASSRISMNNAFDSVQIRLEDLRGLGPLTDGVNSKFYRDEDLYNGVNLGDDFDMYGRRSYAGAWAKFNASVIDQHRRNNIDGFQADNTGIAIGADWRIIDVSAFGAALSYNKTNEKDHTPQESKIDTYSYQATFYGWFQPYQSVFVDSMIGVASHQYQLKRNIQIGDIYRTANAKFNGIHYGIQTDVGYAFINVDNWYVAPLVRFKYTYLDIDDYIETGAGGLSLAVKNDEVDELIAGPGLRVAIRKDYAQAIYVPEFSAMLLYDFSAQPMQMASTFLGGGNPFYINSINPAQLIYLFGLGVNAHTSDHYTFGLKFNFEYRDHLFGYNGYAQLHYTFA